MEGSSLVDQLIVVQHVFYSMIETLVRLTKHPADAPG
jgi:hypothetical protein